MGWKTINNKRYYYHMFKHNGSVRSRYVPADLAEYFERETRARKAARQDHRDQLAKLRAKIAVEEQPLIDYDAAMASLYAAYKISEGYHLHSRSWRRTDPIYRRRGMNIQSPEERSRDIAAEMARRAVAAGEVQGFIDKYHGHADQNSLACLLRVIAVNDKAKEAYRLRVKQLAESLAGSNPTAIVKIMAMRVAVGWLDVYLSDSIYYMWMDGHDIERATYFDERRGRAARRLIQAVKCLADVQRIKVGDVNTRLPRFEFARVN